MKNILDKDYLSRILDLIEKQSFKRKMLILVIIWALIFIPSIVHHSMILRDEHTHFYPIERGPGDYTPLNWNVETNPVPLEEQNEDGWLILNVSRGEKVSFQWLWHKKEDQRSHIGVVDVLYKENARDELKLIRLREQSSDSSKDIWVRNKTFQEDKEIKFYFKVGETDIPIYDRRASIILDGKNPYEETRTGPPPLIHFMFIPAALLTAPENIGGTFLSFNIYFSLFVLLDALLLFYSIKDLDESKAYLASMIFVLNPITIFTVHQDEPIIVFLMILPLFLSMRNRKYLSSLSIGISAVAKIWTAFWIPVMLMAEGLKKLKYLLVIGLSGLSVFLLFLLMWGEKVLWFLRFYGGTAGKENIGGISFWNHGLKVFGISEGVLPTTIILILIGLVELFIWYLAWKKDWRPISMISAFFLVFIALYPKIHWEYVLLLLPFMSILAAERDRYLLLFYAITIFTSLTMFLGRLGKELSFIPFLTSIILLILLIYTLVSIYKEDGKISKIDFNL